MRLILASVLLVTLLGACSTDDTLDGPAPTASPAVVLPDGWRWESYRGVEVGVPGDWGSANGSQRMGQWCVEGGDRDRAPAIGRPGGSTLVACGIENIPPSETLIENTGVIVAFEDAVLGDGSPARIARGGDREIVRMRDVHVIVQVPQPLRDQIVATVREAEVDANECPATDPVSRDLDRRPDAAVDVATLRGIQAVSVCKYRLEPDDSDDSDAPTLVSSLRIVGNDAFRLVRQIAKAQAGGGPESPQNCLPELLKVRPGEEAVVLRIESAARVSWVPAPAGTARCTATSAGISVNGS